MCSHEQLSLCEDTNLRNQRRNQTSQAITQNIESKPNDNSNISYQFIDIDSSAMVWCQETFHEMSFSKVVHQKSKNPLNPSQANIFYICMIIKLFEQARTDREWKIWMKQSSRVLGVLNKFVTRKNKKFWGRSQFDWPQLGRRDEFSPLLRTAALRAGCDSSLQWCLPNKTLW